jgi:hypothetical protein
MCLSGVVDVLEQKPGGSIMALIADFKTVVLPSPPVEVNLIDYHDVRNRLGTKHLLVKNTGTGDAIIRYYFSDKSPTVDDGEYPTQKSIDTDIENLVPAGTTKHIVLEGSWFVEQIKVTAILSGVGPTAIVSGKLLSPPPTDSSNND